MENVLEHICKEFQNDVGQFAFFIDIEINGRKLDGLLIIEHPEEEERNVVVVIELKNISGDIKANLDLENEKWLEKTERGTWEVLTYKNGKKIKPLTQCKKYSKEVAELLKKSLEEEHHDEVEFWHLFPLIRSITILPDDAIFKLENYSNNLKKWFNVINEKDIAKRITKQRKECDLSIPFEDAIKLLKKHATKPDSKQGIKELKTEKEINQFSRDLKESKDVPEQKSEPEIYYPQIKTALSSNNKQDIEFAFEVINFLELYGHKDEILSLRKHRDPEIRKITLENLDKWLDGKELTMEILKYVDDEYIGVWKKADELMYAYGTRSALPKYTDILKNSDYFERVYSAINVFKTIGEDETVEILIELFDKYPSRFGDAIERKAKREARYYQNSSEKELLETIKRRINESLQDTERKILETIKEIGGPKVIPFAQRLLDEYLDEYQELLESHRSDGRFDQSESDRVFKVYSKVSKALELLGQSRSEDAIPLLSYLIKNEKYMDVIQHKAMDSITQLDFESTVQILIEILENDNYDFILKFKAIESLGDIGSEKCLEHLHMLLEKEKIGEYIGVDNKYSRQLEVIIVNGLRKVSSNSSFDPLYKKYGLFGGTFPYSQGDEDTTLYNVSKILAKIDKGKFDKIMFEILTSEDIEKRYDIMCRLDTNVNKAIINQMSHDSIEKLIKILMGDIHKKLILDDELIEKIYVELQNNDLERKPINVVNEIVDKLNIFNPYDPKEKVQDLDLLLCLFNISTEKSILSDCLFQLICNIGTLPQEYIDMIKEFVTSDKPNLRVLGLELIDKFYSIDAFRADEHILLEDFINIKRNDKLMTILQKITCDGNDIDRFLDDFDVNNHLIPILEKIGTEEAVIHLFDYLKREDIQLWDGRNPAYLSLKNIMYSEEDTGKNYGGKNDIPIPDWMYNEIPPVKTDYDIDIQEFFKFIAYYWEHEAIELFKGYIEDCDNTLKLHVCHSLSYLKFEEIKPLLKRLVLDPNPRVREVAINTYMYITGKKLYTNDVIRKAEADEL